MIPLKQHNTASSVTRGQEITCRIKLDSGNDVGCETELVARSPQTVLPSDTSTFSLLSPKHCENFHGRGSSIFVCEWRGVVSGEKARTRSRQFKTVPAQYSIKIESVFSVGRPSIQQPTRKWSARSCTICRGGSKFAGSQTALAATARLIVSPQAQGSLSALK